MLVELLLQQLASDYAPNRADVPLVAKLIHNRDQQIELLRIDATGLDALDQKEAAWDAYLRLADFTAEEPAYLRVDNRYSVRSDRWIASRLGAIWSQALADDRKQLEDKIAARRPALKNALTAAEMRHYLAHMGELPGADDVRLALASYMADRGRSQEAEIELLQLVNGKSSDDVSRVALELLAKLDATANERIAPRHVKWPLGKVESKLIMTTVPNNNERMARAPMERQNGYRQLRVEQDYWPEGSDLQWFVAMDSSELVGRNSLGEDVYHLAIDTTALPRNYKANSGLIHGATLGHLLFVTVGGQVMAIDSRQDAPDAEGDLLWPSRALEELSAEVGRMRRGLPPAPTRTSRPPVYHNLSGRQRLNGSAGSASGSLGPVTPRGVVFQDAEELKCVDPLSGLLLWARTDVPVGCELFGDDEFVFAADVGNHEAYVVRLSDGELLGKREVPRSEWLLTTGRNLAQLNFSLKQITVTDIWTQKTVYQGKFPENMRLSVIEPNAIAAFDPTGKFQVLDVASGKMLIDTKLEPISELQAIVTMRTGDDLFLFVSSHVQQQTFKPIGQPTEFPLINGPVYAFSLKTGEPLWPSPALVRNRGVVLQQPRDIPFLVFADRQMQRDAMNGSSSQLRVLCLDRRTGQTVYRNDAIPETAVVRFRVRGEADSRPAVAVELGTSKIRLTMTDTPRPPQPPGNDDLEAPREIVERGLPAIGQRMWGAFRGAMDKPVPGAVQRQPQQVLPQQPNPKLQPPPQQPAKPAKAPPAQKSDSEFDDD